MSKIMESRWCESCDSKCESTFCIENNMCAQIADGMASTIYTNVVNKAKIYNEWQLKIFEQKVS